MLDINLNGEKVCPVADALAERGVLFVFADQLRTEAMIPHRYALVTRYCKPVDPQRMARALFT